MNVYLRDHSSPETKLDTFCCFALFMLRFILCSRPQIFCYFNLLLFRCNLALKLRQTTDNTVAACTQKQNPYRPLQDGFFFKIHLKLPQMVKMRLETLFYGQFCILFLDVLIKLGKRVILRHFIFFKQKIAAADLNDQIFILFTKSYFLIENTHLMHCYAYLKGKWSFRIFLPFN